jgi:hypothetical protein
MKYISRHVEGTIDKINKMYPAVIVTGPRQVGKTTTLKQNYQNAKFVTFDDPGEVLYATESPKQFFQTHKPPVILDEVQYVPELFRYIKLIADDTQQSGMFYMTGSQTFKLMECATESLAGRIGIIELMGLSLREILDIRNTLPFIPTTDYIDEAERHKKPISNDYLWKIIHKGSMPKLYTSDAYDNETEWSQYYSNYLRTYIEKDIRAIINIGNERAFMQFMRLLAANTGQMINFSSIASEIGKEINTVKAWVSALLNSGIIYVLQPYFSNINKRIVKTPKVYFLDTGLCSYLTGWYTAHQLQFGAMSGAFFETFVISEIIKSYRNNGIDIDMRFSYYRDKDQREIDLIIEENGKLYPIEIKKTANPSANDISAFRLLDNEPNKKLGGGALIYSGDEVRLLKDNIRAIPVGVI